MKIKTFDKQIWLIIGIILVAFNLRPSITAVGPLIGSIRDELAISNGMAGMLTTLPLLAFAVLSAIAPRIGLKIGNGLAILIGIAVLALGILIRSVEMLMTLFAGTALIGIGVAICNVLLPGIVKQKFPAKIGLLTGLYSISMSGFAAIGSGVSFPLAQTFDSGWQGSLMIWALLSTLAFIAWLPHSKIEKSGINIPKIDIKNSPLFRSRLAWQVTIFMGMQSFMFYCLVAWLPEILQSRGMEPSTAGWMLSWMQIVGLPSTFLTPILAGRMRSQRRIVLTIGFFYLIGLAGLQFGAGLPLLTVSTAIIGLAQGSSISLALTLLSLRAASSAQAANLSGMAQSIGYFLAAIGPITIGFLFDLTGSWVLPIAIFASVVVAMIFAGVGAGKNEYVPEARRTESA
ncbi:CynX/NimT family MFS transporter [Halobacillus seohaensis]|uniref:CynX/NimT family MFS transporter n=1 Tax=Halobacillus seohaensis TaxID=447421 RepID=A0ABW2EL76_9BACI